MNNRSIAACLALFLLAAPTTLSAQAAPPGVKTFDVSPKIGQRVVADFGTGWLESVVTEVDQSKPFPYRVHPLGYLSTMDSSFKESMLREEGWGPTKPIGGIANDPWLLKVQGKKAFRPTAVLTGAYECYTYSGGRLVSAMALNFSITGPASYRDSGGKTGAYSFDPASLELVFKGGGLTGQHAKYAQASSPPTAKQPPSVTFDKSGDSCDRKM